MRINFYVRFSTQHGQSLSLSRTIKNKSQQIIPMEYLNEEFWHVQIDSDDEEEISYQYILSNPDHSQITEWENDRRLDLSIVDRSELSVIDTWNHAGEFDNAFFTAPFSNVLLKSKNKTRKAKEPQDFNHFFKVKAPLLNKDEVVCLLGSCDVLNHWSEIKPVQLNKDGNWWSVRLQISKKDFPIAYKYGVYNLKEKKFVRYEEGNNRILHGDRGKKSLTILHDGFVHLPNTRWKGAGVAIPVFSLRSKNSFGVGEFTDLKLLVDWSQKSGLKLIQLLPINDTMATNTSADSYPYAAISAFALHPIYINLENIAGKDSGIISGLKKKQKQLNQLAVLDYEQVIKVKIDTLQKLYEALHEDVFEEKDYKQFFESHKHWLVPYAAFCYLRDKYGTADYQQWMTLSVYNKNEIDKLTSPGSKTFHEIAFYYFVQYHLHLQLQEATEYAHKNQVVIKGDIPIGVYRHGCDTWVAPELYNLDMQAGAPPDDFAVKGQNWGFPTYNWQKMQENDFEWWKQRFRQMNNYFDAFRIDHILGFFRIWSIPLTAVEGIMGHFIPAIPVYAVEFGEKGIWFDHDRYCKPYIDYELLWNKFRELGKKVSDQFLIPNDRRGFYVRPEFETQAQINDYFDEILPTEENQKIRDGLFDIISNVILFEEENSKGEKFHFRISMENTTSFQSLDWHVQRKLKDLYLDYFFQRQDEFWKKEGMQKLPPLKRSTNMLVCGEDLGMVPHCVPEVMNQLGILSLEIQRMPKNPHREFFHPNDAPYLSVVTPSTHDMSTIRGWWEEDRAKTQRFFNQLMGQWGNAPYYCEAWVNRAIVMQHLYSPAMWSIFLLQDILGMSETLRRENPHEERINIPANPNHYWKYRMHITLEELLKEKDFSAELNEYIQNSGR
jgi:4-alpha-glucanotransferase